MLGDVEHQAQTARAFPCLVALARPRRTTPNAPRGRAAVSYFDADDIGFGSVDQDEDRCAGISVMAGVIRKVREPLTETVAVPGAGRIAGCLEPNGALVNRHDPAYGPRDLFRLGAHREQIRRGRGGAPRGRACRESVTGKRMACVTL